jgi:hypothetical protein
MIDFVFVLVFLSKKIEFKQHEDVGLRDKKLIFSGVGPYIS